MLFLPGGVDQEIARVEAYATALRVGLGTVVLVGVLALRRRRRRGTTDREAVRAFVVQNGRTSTAPLLTVPDNVLLPLCSGDALAAVGIRGGVAVCLGGPVSVAGREAEALTELTAYCEETGLTPALLGADTTQCDLAEDSGYSVLQIGVEAALDVQSFSTAGNVAPTSGTRRPELAAPASLSSPTTTMRAAPRARDSWPT